MSEVPYNQSGHLRTEIYRKCHIIDSSNEETIKFWLGKSSKINGEELIQRFGYLKPCIHGSDAHSFEKICKPDEERFCWIKADPCFEGLLQIIYEPEERVRIQSENPEIRKNIYTLDSVEMKNCAISDELSLEEQNIPLNRNLVAVTGGKGSGKTALLDLIANCFEDRCKRAGEDKNSFVQRIEDQKEDLEVEIEFIGEGIGNFSKELLGEKFFQDSRITYLPQGKIEEYSGDRTKLDKKIKEIIFSNDQVKAKGYKQEFDRLGEEIGKAGKEIDETNRKIYDLEEETTDEIISEIESKKGIKEGELRDRSEELKEVLARVDADLADKIKELKGKEIDARTRLSKFENIRSSLNQLKGQLQEFLESSNTTINDINHDLTELKIEITIPEFDFRTHEDVIEKSLNAVSKNVKSVTEEIEVRTAQLTTLSGVEKTHADLLTQIDGVRQEIKSLDKQLAELGKKKEEIKYLESNRTDKYLSLVSNYWKWKTYYEEVMQTFSEGKSEILGGIGFESTIYFDKNRFVEIGSDVLDQRSVKKSELEKNAEELGAIVIDNTHEESEDKLKEFIKNIYEKRVVS